MHYTIIVTVTFPSSTISLMAVVFWMRWSWWVVKRSSRKNTHKISGRWTYFCEMSCGSTVGKTSPCPLITNLPFVDNRNGNSIHGDNGDRRVKDLGTSGTRLGLGCSGSRDDAEIWKVVRQPIFPTPRWTLELRFRLFVTIIFTFGYFGTQALNLRNSLWVCSTEMSI